MNISNYKFCFTGCIKKFLITNLFAYIFVILSSCSNDNPANNNVAACGMKAKVDTIDWCSPAVFELVTMFDIKTLVITGEQPNGDKITIAINSNAKTGTFNFNDTDYAGYTIHNGEIFVSQSGSVTLTRLDINVCEGVFSFNSHSASSNNTRMISNGSFKATPK